MHVSGRWFTVSDRLLTLLRQYGVTVQPMRWNAGELIFARGDAARHLFIGASGCIRLYRLTSTGKEAVVRWCSVNDLFGEECLVTPYRINSAEAVTASTAWCIAKEDLEIATAKHPLIARQLLLAVSDALRVTELVATALSEEIPQRIRCAIEWLQQRGGLTRQAGFLVLPFTHAQLASLIGTSRECVTVHLKMLQDSGVLLTRRRSIAVRPEWLGAAPAAFKAVPEPLP